MNDLQPNDGRVRKISLALDAGDIAAAEFDLSSIDHGTSASREVRTLRLRLLAAQGRLRDALDVCEALRAERSDDPAIDKLYISLLIESGQLALAQQLFAARIWPSEMSPEAKTRLLRELRDAMPAPEGDALLERLYARDGLRAATQRRSDAALRLRAAQAEFRAGFLPQALATLEAGGDPGELSAAAQSLRSSILAALGREPEALDSARAVLAAKPHSSDVVLNVAQRLIGAQRIDDAVLTLESAVHERPADERLLSRIVALPIGAANVRRLSAVAVAGRKRLKAEHAASAAVAPATGADAPTTSTGDLGRDVLRTIRMHVADWEGSRRRPDSVIVGRNDAGRRRPLFWCFQDHVEFGQLAVALGSDRPLFGMRSGHLIIEFVRDEVQALAACYAREMLELQPSGPFQLGGNCQGGIVAREIAFHLRAAGREVSILILMEQAHFHPYDGPVSLVFGRDSNLNPYVCDPHPERVFAASYPRGYCVDFVECEHGEFFRDANVTGLARIIESRLPADSD